MSADVPHHERHAIVGYVVDRLSLDDETAHSLVDVAEHRNDRLWSNWLFTEAVKECFDESARLEVIERLWQVAAADGVVDEFESELIARIGRRIGVSAEAIASCRERVAGGES